MSKKKTIQEFIQEANLIHNNFYDYSLAEYVNNKTKLKIICPKHGEFLQTPSDHLTGYGCPECKREKLSKINKKSNEDFVAELTKKFGTEKWNYSSVDYQGKDSKVKVICKKCGGEIEKTARSMLKNIDCKCYKISVPRPPRPKTPKTPKVASPKKTTPKTTTPKKSKIVVPVAPRTPVSASFEAYILGLGFTKNGDYYENADLAVEYGNVKTDQITSKRKIQIVEYDWKMQNEKIKALFETPKRRLFARKCKVREIDNQTYREFAEANHLQNYAPASVRLGLFYNDELVQIETYGKARYKRCQWELIRECSKAGVYVVGGKSRLLKHFEDNYHPSSLVSYCEKNKFSGNSYIKCGFKLVDESNPGYYYYKNNCKYSRVKFQKHKLKNLLPIYDENATETENMLANNYEKIYDYGNWVFVKEY